MGIQISIENGTHYHLCGSCATKPNPKGGTAIDGTGKRGKSSRDVGCNNHTKIKFTLLKNSKGAMELATIHKYRP